MPGTRIGICCCALVLACGGRQESGGSVEGTQLALGAAPGPYLSPEFPLDHPALGTGRNNFGAKAAFDGTRFLVVWRDGREESSRIYATRVDGSGKVLEPLGIRLTTTSTIQSEPDLAFGAGTFLAVWEESSGTSRPKILAARVSSTGAVLDPAGFVVSTESYGDQLSPAVAFDGTNFMVTWALGGSSGGRIAAARVSPAGKVLDATPITVSKITSTYAEAQGEPAIAFDGTNYLIAWQDDRNAWWDIYANRVSPAGSVLDGNGFAVASAESGENTPAIAFDGTNFLVTWSDWPGGGSRASSIYARRVSPAGTVLDEGAIAVCTATGEQTQPTVLFDGSQFVVAWTDYRAATGQIHSARVRGDGQVLDTDGRALTNTEGVSYEPSLALGEGQVLLTRSNGTVWAGRMDLAWASKDGAGFPLVSTPTVETDPAVAFGATDYLVTWVDSRLGGWNVFGGRVSPHGAVLDPRAFAISTGPDGQTNPLVAWNGTQYLVVWFGAKPAGRRVAPDGTVVDATDIPLPGLGPGGIASDGSGFLVVGTQNGETNAISGYRISAAGVLLDATPFTISTGDGSRSGPRVVFDGTNYLVVWRDSRAGSYRPYAARVSSAGAVLDADGLALADATVALSQDGPEVASDGAGSGLVVWVDSRSYALAGTRINGNTAADPAGFQIAARPTTSDLLSAPRVVFDGTNYLVAFVDQKLDSSYHVLSYTLKTARVSPQGAVLAGLQVATHPSKSIPAQVASDRAGGSLVAYELPDTAWGFPIQRLRARLFSEEPPGGTCRAPADCESGFCVDGVCCDSACGADTDCMACSKAAGGSTDGICGPVVDGYGCSDSNACTVNDTCTQGMCAGLASTSVPGKTCSGSVDAGRADGFSGDAARADGGVARMDGAGSDLRTEGPPAKADARPDSAWTTDASARLDAGPTADAALAPSDARPADSHVSVPDAGASVADAGLTSSVDAQAAKKSPSGCSCNQGHAPSGALWPLALLLILIAPPRFRD